MIKMKDQNWENFYPSSKKSIYLIASNFSKLWSASSASFLIRSFLPSCASFRRSNSRAFNRFSFNLKF